MPAFDTSRPTIGTGRVVTSRTDFCKGRRVKHLYFITTKDAASRAFFWLRNFWAISRLHHTKWQSSFTLSHGSNWLRKTTRFIYRCFFRCYYINQAEINVGSQGLQAERWQPRGRRRRKLFTCGRSKEGWWSRINHVDVPITEGSTYFGWEIVQGAASY